MGTPWIGLLRRAGSRDGQAVRRDAARSARNSPIMSQSDNIGWSGLV